MLYYADQNNNDIRLLQTSDYKRYKLSSIKSDEGEIKALINFPFFSSNYIVGRYQGDVFNNTVDQANFEGNNIVIFKDNSYKIGKFNSWDYQDIANISAGFCPSAVLAKGETLEISNTILKQKQFSMTAKINRTALICDGEYHFAVGENVDVNTFIKALQTKYPNYDFIALGDSGGSSELIIDGKIQNKLSDGSERPNYCGLAFIKKKEETKENGSKKLFCPRLSKDGMKNSPYWYDNSINAGAKDGLFLPNCTTYASGRFSELNGQNMRNIMKNRVGFGNAKEWYKETKLEKGSAPKEGAIACFDGTVGHVAIVERVNKDGTVLVSQSNYESVKNYNSVNYFQTKAYKLEVGKVASGVGLKFLGYIYAPYIKSEATRDKNKNQVEVLADKLRIRKTSNGEWVEGIFAPLGLYDIIETKVDGNYTWAKLDNERWIALNDVEGWTKTYLKETQTDKDKIISDLRAELQAKSDEINNLNKKVADGESKLKTAKNELESINNKLEQIKNIIN